MEYKKGERGPDTPRINWAERLLTILKGALLRKVIVYALVGPSGTGKSFRARIIADRFKIRFIIDDGILIRDKRIIAGRSAKRENAYLAAVKVAIFADRVHRHEVRQALEKYHCRRILILATSDRMISKICQTLGLPEPLRVIHIHEVAQEDEIQKALENRKLYGRHIIPVPAREVRKNSASIVTDEIKLWSQQGLLKTEKMYEKTLVRPEFASGEALEVPEHLLKQAIRTTLEVLLPGSRLVWFKSVFQEGYELDIAVLLPDNQAADPLRQEEVKSHLMTQIRKQTGAHIRSLDLKFREIKPKRR